MNIIAAADTRWGIGKNNSLLFHIRADMRYFREKTTGHDIIMGRKTFESFPNKKPLPDRRNIVISLGANIPGCIMARSIDEAAAIAGKDAFVIGGGSIYAAMLDFCSTAYITKIYSEKDADTFFPNLDDNPDWILSEESEIFEENGVKFRFCTYRRL